MMPRRDFSRRRFLRCVTVLPAGLAWSEGAKGRTSLKRGLCTMIPAQAHLVKARWRYDWGAQGKSGDGCEFVPMVKGTPHFKQQFWDHLRTLKAAGFTTLLGYNEPERDSQGNLSVEDAVAHWPKLAATGLRLGSPAPSSDEKGMQWLEAFMKAADKAKLKIDFMALHWYRSADLGDFEGWLKEMHRKYRRPLWLTEFNGGRLSEREHEQFLKGALRLLERHDFVERYAYFTPGAGSPGSLFTKASPATLTELGQIYAET